MIIVRPIFTVLGLIFFGLGFVGMFLPILPTVPFWLLSAACLMRGSARLYEWLMTHPQYGEYIYQYREAKAISTGTKVIAIGTLWVGIILSIWVLPVMAVKIFLAGIATAVTVYLASLTTLQPGDLTEARSSYADFIHTEFGRKV